MAKKKVENPCFKPCIEIYDSWFKSKYPYPPTYNGRSGKSLNEILNKLSGSYKIAKGEFPTTEELIGSFKLVLEKHDLWGFWKDKTFHLWQINDKLIDILESIKANNGKSKESFASAAFEHIKES